MSGIVGLSSLTGLYGFREKQCWARYSSRNYVHSTSHLTLMAHAQIPRAIACVR
jgi:hypothetical protein